ncbi:hypothetical protein BV898_14628 [Hypsibius exemplaris]|uniref:Claspin n=1 Tax=Hypsibius exemplaris TaxID=2072580 RepID=A0A9X6N959_HYPEX|nr:hypothetical protein BV898_14628 [Hypsibius exemplaris]
MIDLALIPGLDSPRASAEREESFKLDEEEEVPEEKTDFAMEENYLSLKVHSLSADNPLEEDLLTDSINKDAEKSNFAAGEVEADAKRKSLVKSFTPEKAAPKRVGRGFMDSSDEERDIEPAPVRKVALKKTVGKSGLSSESEDEEIVRDVGKLIEPEVSVFDGRLSNTSTPKKTTSTDKTWGSSDDEDFVVGGQKGAGQSPERSPLGMVDSDGEMTAEPQSWTGLPRKERMSKKKAFEIIAERKKESQRLMREQKVALPKHAPVAMPFNEFFESMCKKKPDVKSNAKFRLGDRFASSTTSFVDLCNDGDRESGPPPPASKLDRFINRFLVHAKPASVVAPPSSPAITPLTKTRVPELSKTSPTMGTPTDEKASEIVALDVSDRNEKPEAVVVVRTIPASVNVEEKARPAIQLQASQFDRLQKPGTKLSALKAILQNEIMEKKERVMMKLQEKYEAEEAIRKENEVDEVDMDKAEAGEFSDDGEAEMTDGEDDDSDTTESEPDEADIVGDNYGMDEPEREENEFGMAEAEEAVEDEMELSDDEKELIGDEIDLEASSNGEDDDGEEAEDVHRKKQRSAVIEDEDIDPLAGLEINPFLDSEDDHSDSFEESATPEDVPDAAKNNFPISLTQDMDADERERLMQLCGFDQPASLPVRRSDSDECFRKTGAAIDEDEINFRKKEAPEKASSELLDDVYASPHPNPFQRDIMGSIEDAAERGQLMGLLSCASADFMTIKPPSRQVDDKAPPDSNYVLGVGDGSSGKPANAAASKKAKAVRRKRVLDSDDEEEGEEEDVDVEDASGHSASGRIHAGEEDEEQKEEISEAPRRRVVRPAESSSDDEADDEADGEEEEEDFASGDGSKRFQDEDEEMEYLERQFKPDMPARLAEFVEGEAELSDDDYQGSGDEDEDGLDEVRQEDLDFQDNRHYSLTKQQRAAIPEYLRKIGEDDENLQEALEDRFIHPDDELPKLPATSYGDGITFRLNEDGEELDDENVDASDAAEDNAWRVQRFEREKLLASLEPEHHEELDPLPTGGDNSFAEFCKATRGENAEDSFNLQSESFSTSVTEGTVPGLFRKNSLLSRGSAVLARLNEVIDVEERKTAPQPLLAMQSAQYRKSLSINEGLKVPAVSGQKLQRTESSPAGEGPSAKRRKLGESFQPAKKPSIFSVLKN